MSSYFFMKIFLDTADVSMISPAYETGLLDGVTTNPSLILKSGRQLLNVIQEIATEFKNLESISAEVVADTSEEMLSQAQKFYTIAPAVTIKVPCTVEGLKTCKFLTDKGIQVNVTLVFSVAQAILASKAGATFISPFVGRWMDNSIDGIELIKNIRKAFDYSGTSTQILAASLRDVRQVEQSALNGADVVTIPPVVFWAMYKNIMTEKGLDLFQKDWEEVLKSVNDEKV
jgi:TalC/MipB family fructose-6-phosphate aldolase